MLAGEDQKLTSVNWNNYSIKTGRLQKKAGGGSVLEREAKHGPDSFSTKVWRATVAVGSESRSPVRVAEEDSSFVPSLSPNQFCLASPK